MLLFNAQYAVRHLRDWGFDMFDDVVDHAYDAEPDKHVRQQMILSQLATPINYDPVLFEQRAKHNRELLKTYQQQWPSKIQTVLKTIADISGE